MGELRVKGPVRRPSPDAVATLTAALGDGTLWDGGSPDDVLTIGDDGTPIWEPLTVVDGGTP
jgi:hypothetical protein